MRALTWTWAIAVVVVGTIETKGDAMEMTAEILEDVSQAVDAAMRARFGDRPLGEDDLPEIRSVFTEAITSTVHKHDLTLDPLRVANVVSAYCEDIEISKPGPWNATTPVLELGTCSVCGGYFANCPDDPAKLIQELGVGDGPFAIGLLAPTRKVGEPEMEGVALSPEQARQLAQVLIEKADECEKGWP